MPTASLADADAAAAVVSAYVDHRTLPQPYLMPGSVQSPEETLSFRSGNSLEMALLLCSLLLGQGLDAAVIIGYAPLDIGQNVQTSQQCPAPAVKRRLEIQRLVQEFLAACSSSLADASAGPRQTGAPAEDTSPEQQNPQAEPAAAPEAGAEAADSQVAAAEAAPGGPDASGASTANNPAAASSAEGDAATVVAPSGSASDMQQAPDAVGFGLSVGSVAPQQNGSSGAKLACPYRLHAWVLLQGHQVILVIHHHTCWRKLLNLTAADLSAAVHGACDMLRRPPAGVY